MKVEWLELYTHKLDQDLLACEILSHSGLEMVLSWKSIYLEKKRPMEEKVKFKALHVEIITILHHQNFVTHSNTYGRYETGFPGGLKMQLFQVKNKTKSIHSNKKYYNPSSAKHSFLEVFQSSTNADIFTLDING